MGAVTPEPPNQRTRRGGVVVGTQAFFELAEDDDYQDQTREHVFTKI